MVEGTPPGDALPPPPQRATPARKGARCGAGAGSPRPHRPHPGHTGRGTLAARSRGRVAGGGTAPDTRRPSQWWKVPPPGTPFRHSHSEQHRPARAHAVGLVLGPYARTDRTRDTRVPEPRPPAQEGGRPGEGQRLTPDAPHNGGRPPPRGRPPQHAAPTRHAGQGDSAGPQLPHTRAHSTWVADPNSPPSVRAVGGGGAPDLRRPSQRWKAPPPGMPFPHPHSEQLRPARAHAVGPVLGPHARTDRTRDTRVAEPRLPAPENRRPGEGQRPTPDAPHNGGRPPPPETAPHHPRGKQPPHAPTLGHAGQGDSVGPPDPHARAHRMWVADPNSPPSGGAVQGGGVPDHRHPSQRWKAPPRERPSATPTASNAGPQGRTLWGRCWLPTPAPTEPRLPAPEDGRAQEGQRLTPDAPHKGGRPSPPGTAPQHPRGTQPPRGMQAKGTVLGPQTHTLAPTARGWRTPTARPVGGQSGEGERLTSDASHSDGRHPPRGRPSATPTASNAGPQGRTLWGRCWVPTPAPTAPGTHGSRNPGCPPQRMGGRRRDSA